MSTRPEEEPGTDEAAESPTLDGYGNDTGFAQEAEEGDESTAPGEPAEGAPDHT